MSSARILLNDQYRIVGKLIRASKVSFPKMTSRMRAKHVLLEINRSFVYRFTPGLWDEQRIMNLEEYDFSS